MSVQPDTSATTAKPPDARPAIAAPRYRGAVTDPASVAPMIAINAVAANAPSEA